MLRQLHIDQFARPFYLIKALSFGVVIVWLKAFSGTIVDASIGNFIDIAYQLPFMLALGFTAWVFWRNIDGISAVTDPLTRIAYRVLVAVSLIGLLAVGLGDHDPACGD